MAKKKKIIKKKPASTEITYRQYLEHLIKCSENAITGHGGESDQLFTQQAAKLRKELEMSKNK